ncbi:hypothetical protein [Saccharopolyspora sp. SCSIO 74807]|uniref:hypothetical protein n=1 Tax=Saccharopolyspora sp. SCSIO 74807 TaxID=3118084 RepID=UPI0030CC5491
MVLVSPATAARWRGRRIPRGVGIVSVATVVLLPLMAGCEQAADAPAPAPDEVVSPPATTSSPADLAAARAREVYLQMWQAMAQAAQTSDWQSPALAEYATGDALTTLSRSLYADHVNKLVTRGRPANHPTVSSVEPPGDPRTVMLSDCGDSANWLKYRSGTDQLADETGGGRRSITAEVVTQPDGSWRVSRFSVQGVGTC